VRCGILVDGRLGVVAVKLFALGMSLAPNCMFSSLYSAVGILRCHPKRLRWARVEKPFVFGTRCSPQIPHPVCSCRSMHRNLSTLFKVAGVDAHSRVKQILFNRRPLQATFVRPNHWQCTCSSLVDRSILKHICSFVRNLSSSPEVAELVNNILRQLPSTNLKDL
jgi:hypothetical protein